MRLSKGKIWLWPNSWGVLRYILPFNWLFHIAARYHDVGYERWWTEDDRKKVDEMFYRLMISVSTNILKIMFAKLYYKLVRKFWYKYFVYIIYSNTNN